LVKEKQKKRVLKINRNQVNPVIKAAPPGIIAVIAVIEKENEEKFAVNKNNSLEITE
jgi:hypothetical protein